MRRTRAFDYHGDQRGVWLRKESPFRASVASGPRSWSGEIMCFRSAQELLDDWIDEIRPCHGCHVPALGQVREGPVWVLFGEDLDDLA